MSAGYFNDMIEWLELAGPLNDKLLTPIIGLNSGGLSKSIIFQVLKTRAGNRAGGLYGSNPDIHFIETDSFIPGSFGDFAPLIDDTRLGTFEDPEHPECTTYASIVKLDKRDPRNPNPQAGTTRHFFVTHKGGREQVKNKTTALAKAEAIHNRLMAEKKAALAEERRQRLLAQERAIEEARRNQEHLTALPAFGGF